MIERVAIKYKETVYAGSVYEDHLSVYSRLHNIINDMGCIFDVTDFIIGYITDDGEFLDMSSAADHAFNCGQIQHRKKKLYPENLK